MDTADEKKRQQLTSTIDELSEVEKAVHEAIESDDAIDRENLDELSSVLAQIKARIPPQGHGDSGEKDGQQSLHESKLTELGILLPQIKSALRPLKQSQPESSEHAARGSRRKKMLSAATGCNPFNKLLPPSSQQKSREQGGGGGRWPQEEDDEEAVLSLQLLLRLAKEVLEPVQYYEWTTSYVDESRIYGWDKEADLVVDALVGTNDSDIQFRAAAITGIHGSGKTALAQKVFVHDRVKDHFPLRLWVCVGPPDDEDRFNLLYRMLDNLGLDTNKVEDDIVNNARVVVKKREEVEKIILEHNAEALEEEARKIVADKEKENPNIRESEEFKQLPKQLLKQKVERSVDVQKSKFGVLLYILHMTLSKTGYLIVFDDIRAYRNAEYGDEGWTWYTNLTLPPPPENTEWGDRLAYGLPKTVAKHRCAVLVTCRKEDDARAMVRTGHVFRPPKLEVDDGWKLFEREYKQVKEEEAKKNNKDKEYHKEEDLLLKQLETMKKQIVDKCLGLPVAVIEAAKGFARSGFNPLPDDRKPLKDSPSRSKDETQADSPSRSMDETQAAAAAAAAADDDEPAAAP